MWDPHTHTSNNNNNNNKIKKKSRLRAEGSHGQKNEGVARDCSKLRKGQVKVNLKSKCAGERG